MKNSTLTLAQKRLLGSAKQAMKYAHAPYSRFRVGAALLTSSGKIYTGCNVEISSYSLTLCAERVASFKAISEGISGFKAIAIISDAKEYISPCGACRQVMNDLLGNIDVIMADSKGKATIRKMKDLLPLPFNESVLHKLK